MIRANSDNLPVPVYNSTPAFSRLYICCSFENRNIFFLNAAKDIVSSHYGFCLSAFACAHYYRALFIIVAERELLVSNGRRCKEVRKAISFSGRIVKINEFIRIAFPKTIFESKHSYVMIRRVSNNFGRMQELALSAKLNLSTLADNFRLFHYNDMAISDNIHFHHFAVNFVRKNNPACVAIMIAIRLESYNLN